MNVTCQQLALGTMSTVATHYRREYIIVSYSLYYCVVAIVQGHVFMFYSLHSSSQLLKHSIPQRVVQRL